LVTTAPAPTTAFFPIIMPASKVEFAQIMASFSTVTPTRRLLSG
jgi:hypothetical protein